MSERRLGVRLGAIAVVVALLGLAAGGYYWFTRPSGLAAIPNPAVIAPGGFRASVGDDRTITIGLEIRNTANLPLTVVGAQITPPPGLTRAAMSIIPTGPENEGFTLEGELPALTPVQLGTEPIDRNAILAARFKVDCARLAAADDAFHEQIFVTIQIGDEQRVEELTPPVVGDLPWLMATAQGACTDPLPTGTPEPPLPTLPSTTTNP